MWQRNIILSSIFLFLSIQIYANAIMDNYSLNSDFIRTFSTEKKVLDLGLIDTNLKITHAVFAGITYAGLWAMDAVGIPLLYYAFTKPDFEGYKALKYAHLAIAISTLFSFAAVVSLAFTKLGIKLKNKFAIRKTHLAAAIVTLSFYLLELSSIILSAVFFGNKLENAQWVGLAHGITCGATTLAFSVSFITIFF